MNKYEMIGEKKIKLNNNNVILKRVRALKSFANIKKGQIGGWVEGEWNLSQEGDCWVDGEAKVWENAKVSENAQLWGKSCVYGNAQIYGEASVWGESQIFDNAKIFDEASIFGYAKIFGNVEIGGKSKICNNTNIEGFVKFIGNIFVCGDLNLNGNMYLGNKVELWGLSDELKIFNWHSDYPIVITKYPKVLYHCGGFSGNAQEFLRFMGFKKI